MEQFARPPGELTSTGPMDKAWKNWKQQFEIFLKASGATEKTQEVKSIMLMNLIGPVGQEASNHFVFNNPDDKDNLDIMLKKFDDYFDPQKTECNERYVFFTRSKKNNESIDDFVADLKKKASTCNFGDLSDSLVRDKIILDTKDKALRNMLLREENLDLNLAVKIWETHEVTNEKLKQMCQETKAAAAAAAAPKGFVVLPRQKNKPSTSKPAADVKFKNDCWRCGTQHAKASCPAYGKKCPKCQQMNHFAHKCTAYLAKGEQGAAPKGRNTYQKNNAQDKNMLGPFSQIVSKIMNDI